jgi:putative transposase
MPEGATLFRPTDLCLHLYKYIGGKWMSQYRRNYAAGGTYFFTVNLLERNKSVLTNHIGILRESVFKVKRKRPFEIVAWVVLPDHLHAVWTLPEGDSDYSSRWREIKKAFSRQLPKKESLSATRLKHGERGIWQRRFWEHTITSELDYQNHVDYVYLNPLKHGLVDQVKDWPYSSFHRDVARGLYENHWCGTDISDKEPSFGERK